MKIRFGHILILAGIALGTCIGFLVLLVCGIADIMNAVKVDSTSAQSIALGVATIIVALAAGVLSSLVLALPGVLLLKYGANQGISSRSF